MSEQEATIETYRIPSANIGELREKLAKLNKRAAKLGTAPISLEVLSTETVEEKIPGWTLDNGEVMEWRTVAREYNTVHVHGETPTLNGWQFVATLIHGENGTVINRVPTFSEEVDLSQYRDSDPSQCDHCGLDRRRVDTFVVYNEETGAIQQVGRQCLKDFLGYNDPIAIAKQLERIREFLGSMSDAEHDRSWRSPALESVTYYLTHVAACIREFGWKAASQVQWDEQPTSVEAYYNMMDYGNKSKDGRKLYIDYTDEDVALAEAATEWNKTHWNRDGSEFESNMAIAFADDYFNVRVKGFVAYGIQAYNKDRQEVIEREAQADKKPSEWQGEVKVRQVFEGLTVSAEIPMEGQFGTTYLYNMVDPNGNVFKWFASTTALEVGETYNLKATVKKHDEWKGQKQTVLTRAATV